MYIRYLQYSRICVLLQKNQARTEFWGNYNNPFVQPPTKKTSFVFFQGQLAASVPSAALILSLLANY